jgi:hypothetical protein
MSLTESIVPPMRDAALTCFRLRLATARHVGELVPLLREVGQVPHLASGKHAGGTLTATLSQGERESYGQVVLVERLREAFWHLIPGALGSRTLATLRDPAVAGLPKLLSGELSVASALQQAFDSLA